MPRQQQVDDALARAFDGRKPSGKVSARLDGDLVVVWHYTYRILTYDLRRNEPVDWAFDPAGDLPAGWKPTDRRILAAALETLQENGQKLWNGADARAATAPTSDESAFEERVVLGSRFGSVTLARGHEIKEKGSRFLALACFPVPTRAAGDAGIALLRSRPEVAGATHRIVCYRAIDGVEWMDDDGEARAGSSLRAALRKIKVKGVAVVVARWYGGVNIGKARFRHVQERATSLLRSLGHTPGGQVLCSKERVWAVAGAGYTLGHTNGILAASARTVNAKGTAVAAEMTVDTNAGIAAATGAVQLEQRRAHAAAAAEARFSGGDSAIPAQDVNKGTKLSCVVVTSEASVAQDAAPSEVPAAGAKRQREPEQSLYTQRGRHQERQRQRWQKQGWVCKRCTLINDAAVGKCVVCAAGKPALSLARAQLGVVNLVDSSGSDDDKN